MAGEDGLCSPGIRAQVFAQDVGAEGPDRLLLRLQLQIDAERFTEQRHILLARQPRREIDGFAQPNVAQLDAFKPPQSSLVQTSSPFDGKMDRKPRLRVSAIAPKSR